MITNVKCQTNNLLNHQTMICREVLLVPWNYIWSNQKQLSRSVEGVTKTTPWRLIQRVTLWTSWVTTIARAGIPESPSKGIAIWLITYRRRERMLKDVEKCGCFHGKVEPFLFCKAIHLFSWHGKKIFLCGRDFNQTKHLEGKCFGKYMVSIMWSNHFDGMMKREPRMTGHFTRLYSSKNSNDHANLKWKWTSFILEVSCFTSWWFQPSWKLLVKLDHFPK